MAEYVRGKPVTGGEYPHFHPAVDFMPEVSYEDRGETILKSWTVRKRSRVEQIAAVKAEARRRILDRFPEWKQANMTAAGVELQDAWRRNGKWTDSEVAMAGSLQSSWDWIKRIREISDEIEQLDPVPSDFNGDDRWKV